MGELFFSPAKLLLNRIRLLLYGDKAILVKFDS